MDEIADKYEAYWNSGELSVAELLANYAHELAEKIRKHEELEPIDHRQPQAWRDGYADGSDNAADLIDPEVK